MRLLLLLLPAVALASMEVKLDGEVYFNDKYIMGHIVKNGFEKRVITSNDYTAFEIQEEELESAVERYHGKKPDRVFLVREDLNGSVVQVKIEIDTMYLTEMTTEKEVLTRTVYENTHSETNTISIQESATTYDSVTSIWYNPHRVSANTVDVSFNFEVERDMKNVKHTFGFDSNSKVTLRNDRTQKGSLDLAAGQKVLAQLEAKKGNLVFQVLYKASLTGNFVAYYSDTYKDQQFHILDINAVLGDKSLFIYQILTYEIHYGQTLNIINADDGYTVLKSFATEGLTSDSYKRKVSAAQHAASTGKKISLKAMKEPFKITDEDLKTIKVEALKDENDEESSESSEQGSTK